MKDGIVREVDLTNSTLTDADMEILGTLTSLEQLILNGCTNLTNAGLAPVQRLTKLNGLALERTRVTDAGLAHLKGLTGLKYLSLNWTKTSDEGAKHLEKLTNLEVLYLCDTKVGDASLASLSQMPKLQWLDLRGTKVTDAGLPQLGKLPRISRHVLAMVLEKARQRGPDNMLEIGSQRIKRFMRPPEMDLFHSWSEVGIALG